MKDDFDESIVTVKNKTFSADKIIKLPVENENFEITDCTCVFSIIDPKETELQGILIRKYVWAEKFNKLNKTKANSKKGEYYPQFIFCFTDTKFPLKDFLKEQNLEKTF